VRAGPARGDRGSAAVEMAIVAPAVFLLLMLVIFAGRVTEAKREVLTAATAAARAASLQSGETSARGAAQAAAAEALDNAGLTCTPMRIEFGHLDLSPGGSVNVTVFCTADVASVAMPGIAPDQTVSAEATEVVDRYRGTG
jgi:Flp pilus assembly protein TadG